MQTSFKTIKKENIFKAALILVTFLFLTASGILFKQSFLRMIPLYISLIVGLLQSNVNRYAPLIGGINSIIYAAVFMYYHLYASAASALFMSCPLQLITFVLWNKKPWGNSTVLKRLSAGKRAILIAGSVLAWILICFFLSETDSSFRELDTAVTVLGTVSTVLTMLSYYEYTATMLLGGVGSILLYAVMLKETPEQVTYLGYSIYSFICTCMAFVKVHSLYDEQQKANNKTESK